MTFRPRPSWILWVFCFGVFFVGVYLLLPELLYWQRSKSEDVICRRTGCLVNLKRIEMALFMYEDRNGEFPMVGGDDFFLALLKNHDVDDPKVFECPELQAVRRKPGSSEKLPPSGFYVDYQLNPQLVGKGSAVCAVLRDFSPNTPWIWERTPNHVKKRCVLFVDYRMCFLDETEFQALLKGSTPK